MTRPQSFEVEFLSDGGQTADDVAGRPIAFLDEAERTIDVAIYDFHAREGAEAAIADALEAAQRRGIGVRVTFNIERSLRASAPRPMQGDPDVIDGLDVPTHGIAD